MCYELSMANRITSVVIDALDPAKLAEFWAAVLGWSVIEADDDGISLGVEDGPFRVDLLQIPDGAKVVKNRLHLDVSATDRDQDAELERLLALGASRVDIGQASDVSWYVLADPEGNEFCLLRGRVEP